MSLLIKLKKLPVYNYLPKIRLFIRNKPMCLLGGPTGSGKTCGITGIMIEDWYQKKNIPNIPIDPRMTFISLPTITAVRSLYNYQEQLYPQIVDQDILGWSAGGEIHYNVGKTPVVIATTQHIINRMIKMYKNNDTDWNNFALMVDEAHHPSSENYVLIKFAEYILNKKGKNKKRMNMIISSATLNNSIVKKNIPKIEVGYRKYPLKINYHDHTFKLTDKNLLFGQTVDVLAKILETRSTSGVLIFTSGENECEQLKRLILEHKFNKPVVPYAIYGNLPYHLIDEALKEDKSVTKVIIATNIAESSITVPYIDTVIDTCLRRFIHGTEKSTILVEDYVCQDNSIQRAGRAGRTKPGYVYRMMKKDHFDKLQQHDQNEFHRIIPYSQVINFMANELPADKILKIEKLKYIKILEKLEQLNLIKKKKNKVLPRAFEAIKYPVSIESATALTYLKNREDNLVYLTLMTISMLEASRGGGLYWYPYEYRSGKKMFSHQNKYYSRFSGECDLDTMVKLFIAMETEPKGDTRKAYVEWVVKNKLNSKTLMNARNLFYQLLSYFDDSNYKEIKNNKLPKIIKQLMEEDDGIHYENMVKKPLIKFVRRLLAVCFFDCKIDLHKVKKDIVYLDHKDKKFNLDQKRTFSKLFNRKNIGNEFPDEAYALQFTSFKTGESGLMSMLSVVFPDPFINKKKQKKNQKKKMKKLNKKDYYNNKKMGNN